MGLSAINLLNKHVIPLSATLLIFCKQPKLNQGKQRIAATMGAEAALQIAHALLGCALEDARSWPGNVVLSPSTQLDVDWARSLISEVQVIAQPEGNLGERLRVVDQQLREAGHKNVVIIGTDAPILSSAYYETAISALAHSDIVFSAASDGGVTIMASKSGWPEMQELPWSTEKLNEALYQCCKNENLSVSYIQPSYDIDHEPDLKKLMVDLKDDPRPARQALLQLVESIFEKENSYA